MKQKFIFDSNIFDFLLDRSIAIERLKLIGDFYTSNVQYSELKNISNKVRQEKLLKIYFDLNQKNMNLLSGIWIDDLSWDDDQIWIDEIGQIACHLNEGKSIKKWKDALIGEIAKTNIFNLVTNDIDFRKRARLVNIETLNSCEFEKQYLR